MFSCWEIIGRFKLRIACHRVAHCVANNIGQGYHEVADGQEDDGAFRVAEAAHVQQESENL